MTLDQTHRLFLKKDWKTHSFQTFQKQFLEEKQINKPKQMKIRLPDYFQNRCVSGC